MMQGKRWVRAALCLWVILDVSRLFALEPPTSPPLLKPPSTPYKPTTQAQMWNLKNADIRAVIQTISILTGKSFIVDPRVSGSVTLISQKPMTPDELYQVFLSMLQILQFAAVPADGVIKIVPSMDAATLSRQIATNANPGSGDEIVVRVVPVNHVSATELVPVLRPLMSQTGNVTAYMPSNALILAGTASNINRLVRVIHNMDVIDANKVTVVHLKYANAKHVVSVLQSLQNANQSRGGVSNIALAPDDDNNSILINANLINTLATQDLIKQLDLKGAGSDDTQVIRLNYLSAKKLAPVLSKIAQGIRVSDTQAGKSANGAASSGGNDVSIEAETNTNAIIMHAPTPMLNSLTRVIRRLDTRPQEVLVEAIIVKIDEKLLNKLGIVWGTPNVSASGSGTPDAVTTSMTGEALSNSATLNFTRRGVGMLPFGSLTSLLHFLNSNGASDVLSTPSIVVLNNEKATISDGQNVGMANRQYPVSSNTNSSASDNNITSAYNTIQRQDVALSLEVIPQISPNNMIRLQLAQKDDSISAGSGTDNPTIDTTGIKTAVLIRSGTVLVLGGLISNEQEKTEQKFPFFGDLPIVGHLFRYNSHKIEKKSLMVFLRPVIMKHGIAGAQTKHRYAYMRQQQIDEATESIKSKDLPLLPQLTTDESIVLPKPVKTMDLPVPSSTKTK